MLSNIHIDGFRSLLDFKMEIKNGLNVLVGPNGSGKTNIIDALTFARDFVSHDLQTAVSKSGGAQSVFSRERTIKNNSICNFKISGYSPVNFRDLNRLQPNRKELPDTENVWIFYENEFQTTLNRNSAFLGASFQSFRFKIYKRKPAKFPTMMSRVKWDFHIVSKLNRHNRAKPEIRVLNYDLFHSMKLVRTVNPNQAKSNLFDREIEDKIFRMVRMDFSAHRSIMQSLARSIPICRIPLEDITSLNELNISPRQAKSSNDIAKEFGIEANGNGLSATIFRLKKNIIVRKNSRFLYGMGPRVARGLDLLAEIIKYTKQLNPSILGITARTTEDYLENNVYFKIQTEQKEEEFPISKLAMVQQNG